MSSETNHTINARLLPIRQVAQLWHCRTGAVIVETALVLPIILFLLMGMISFGKYLLTAHIVQQAANDAARAAIAGLDEGERETIARRTVDHVLATGGVLEPRHATVSSDELGGMMVVNIAYDISRDPLIRLPLGPSATDAVVSQAVIVLSGA